MIRLLIALVCIGGAVALRGPLAKANALRRAHQFRYTPDPGLVKLASCGHRSSLADLLWLQAIPDLSAQFADLEHKERWLAGVLDVVTDLEPTFVTVYAYGSAYFDLIKGSPDSTIALLEKGVDRNPESIQLRVKLAMALMTLRGDRAAALEHLEWVMNSPDCDSFTAGYCSSILVDDRQDLVALEYWKEYLDSANEQVVGVAKLYLERTRQGIFMRAWEEFQRVEGRRPFSLEELRDDRFLSPAITDEVLACAILTDDGRLQFPRLVEEEFLRVQQRTKDWCEAYHVEHGEWPTLYQLREESKIPLPRVPEGFELRLENGQLEVVTEGS